MHLPKSYFSQIRVFLALGFALSTQLIAQPGSFVAGKDAPAANQPRDPAFSTAASIRDESRELTNARLELERLSQDFGDQHPKIVTQRQKISMLEKLEPRKISIDFPGGPISKFVAAVSTNDGISFSVVNTGEPGDLAAELPPFLLRNADVRTVTQVVSNLLLARGFNLEPVGIETNSVVCTLQRRPPPKPQPKDQSQIVIFQSFQLAPYLSLQSVDDIVSAIRTAWELDPTHSPDSLKLKFHPATSILLVSGPQDGIFTTTNILAQLKKASDKESKPERPKATVPSDAEKR